MINTETGSYVDKKDVVDDREVAAGDDDIGELLMKLPIFPSLSNKIIDL